MQKEKNIEISCLYIVTGDCNKDTEFVQAQSMSLNKINKNGAAIMGTLALIPLTYVYHFQ